MELRVPRLDLYHCTQKIKMYLGHSRQQDHTYKLMKILQDNVELIGGEERYPLEYLEDCSLPWVHQLWICGLGKFLCKVGGNYKVGVPG